MQLDTNMYRVKPERDENGTNRDFAGLKSSYIFD